MNEQGEQTADSDNVEKYIGDLNALIAKEIVLARTMPVQTVEQMLEKITTAIEGLMKLYDTSLDLNKALDIIAVLVNKQAGMAPMQNVPAIHMHADQEQRTCYIYGVKRQGSLIYVGKGHG